MTPRLRALLGLVGLIFFATHVVALPRTLEDIDSINFALGVERFDVAAHRPHPPGYPVYVAMGKASTAAAGVIEPGWDRDHRAAAGLAWWGLIAGTLAAFVFAEFWLAAGLTPLLATAASILCVASPLFWFTAARPLTDTPGLVIAVAIQAGLLRGLRQFRRADPVSAGHATLPRAWLWSSLAAGLAIGFRSQTLWLTAPLLVWAVLVLVRRNAWSATGRLVAAAAIGSLLWAVPLVWFSGGLGKYIDAVMFQGSADLSGIDLLSTRWGSRLFRTAVDYTFVQPWQMPLLARVVLGLSLVGLIRLALRDRPMLGKIAVAFLPYLLFHLAFQETVTIRYSLPLLVPIAGLAVIALGMAGSRIAALGALVLAIAGVVAVQPRLQAYSRDGAPVFRAFQAMVHERPAAAAEPVLRLHHQVWWGVLRTIEWYRPVWDLGQPKFPGDREWLEVVEYWKRAETRPVWFLGDVSRNDLVQFDPRSRTLGGRYVMPADLRQLIGGARLDSLTWTKLARPAWMLGRGWALNPEISGMTGQDRAWPHVKPAEAYLLRRPGPQRLMVGGRRLSGSAPALISVDLDGRSIAQWTVPGEALWFVQWIDLPDGVASGSGPYAPLTIRVSSANPGRASPELSLEQFDAAGQDDVMYAFDADWHESESNGATGLVWRWTSGRSTIDVRGAPGDLTLTLSGLSPLRDFDRSPVVVVRAGRRELARFSPATDFSERIEIPAAALAEASGRVTIETDLTFAPSERGQSADKRRLGLRLSQIEIERKGPR